MNLRACDFDLSERVALVVGCSEAGVSLALALGQSGAEIILSDSCTGRIQAAQATLKAEGVAAAGIPFQIDGRDDAVELVNRVVSRHAKLDILVNAQEQFLDKPAVDVTTGEWGHSLHVNLKMVFWTCQAAGKHMLTRGEGSIINLSSLAASLGFPNCVGFAASKGGVEQMTRTLGVEWIRRGVRVNAIAGMGEGLRRQLGATGAERNPMGRFANAADLEGAAIYLASPASAALSGQILHIDGGYSAQ